MKILIDTNILIDFISVRENYFENAKNIIMACKNEQVEGCIAAVSVSNIFYILRNNVPEHQRRDMLKKLCKIVTVIGIDKIKLLSALNNDDFTDFEDCLQSECAYEYGADYIVTRNVKDFKESKVRAITPGEFLKLLNS